jgi:protein-tyrosine-phosphatase
MDADATLPKFVELLSHQVRWAMVQHLLLSDLRVFELVERIGAPMNLLSYHLKKLRDGGMVQAHRSDADGRDVYYTLDATTIRRMYAETGAALAPVVCPQSPGPSVGRASLSGRVLFLCTHNSARSQMAEALLRHAAPTLDVFSAGSDPASRIQPGALQALDRFQIDTERLYPKPVSSFVGEAFDYVITVCDRARESCPHFEGGMQMHWSLSDPARLVSHEQRAAYSMLALHLNERIERLLAHWSTSQDSA